ncbi:5'-3' exoribonuclease 3 [Linum grandiflorum]
MQPESLVPVARFHGSRLASASAPSPYEQSSASSNVNAKRKHPLCSGDNGSSGKSHKVVRLSSVANIGAAIGEAKDSLEIEVQENKEELKIKLKELLREKADVFNSEHGGEDKIKLGEPGWKERYYEEKFSAKTLEEVESARRDVLYLAFRFYSYHYAPFASDLKDLDQMEITFDIGSPFKPFNQLLGVFPAASAHALPIEYRKLMSDPNSPIINFYPVDFEIDMNGKRFAWQGIIAKLPFIDEARLLAEVEKVEHTLTEEEARRNSFMFDMLFVSSSHTLAQCIYLLDNQSKLLTDTERTDVKERINPESRYVSHSCYVMGCSCAGDTHPPVFRSRVAGMDDILDNEVICAIYRLPDYHEHITRPLPGVRFPKKNVSLEDMKPDPVLWHEDSGRRPRDHHDRPNTHGSFSGRKLAVASHRLVKSSLQLNRRGNEYINHMHSRLSHDAKPYIPGNLSYSNGIQDQGHHLIMGRFGGADYSHSRHNNHHSLNPIGIPPPYQQRHSSARTPAPPHYNEGYYPQGIQQGNIPHHLLHPPATSSADYQFPQPPTGRSCYQHPSGGFAAQDTLNIPPPYAYGHHQQGINRFSELDQRWTRVPPPHHQLPLSPPPAAGYMRPPYPPPNRWPAPPSGYSGR